MTFIAPSDLISTYVLPCGQGVEVIGAVRAGDLGMRSALPPNDRGVSPNFDAVCLDFGPDGDQQALDIFRTEWLLGSDDGDQ
jgi:hypothetical protein